MKKYLQLVAGSLSLGLMMALVGCGPSKGELPPTTDKDAIKKEQDRLRNELPGGKLPKYDPIKAEQERLRGGLPNGK